MANNNPSDAPAADDFLEQILSLQTFASADSGLTGPDVGLTGTSPMMLQLNSSDANHHLAAGSSFHAPVYHQLGLSLDQGKGGGFLKPEEASGSGERFRNDVVHGRPNNVKNPLSIFLHQYLKLSFVI
jgi:hypothetical protein